MKDPDIVDGGANEYLIRRHLLTIVVSFLLVLTLNLAAYLSIVGMHKGYGSIRNAADGLSSKMINANLLFREIRADASGKDLNAVWEVFDSARRDLDTVSNFDPSSQIIPRVEAYKTAILEIVSSANNPVVDKEKLETAYEARYSELSDSVKQLSASAEAYAEKYVRGSRIAFILLMVLIAASFLSIFLMSRNFIRRMSFSNCLLEDELDRSRTLVNSVDKALVCVDSSLAVSRCNRFAEKLLLFELGSILGKNFIEISPSFKRLSLDFIKVVQLRKELIIEKEKINLGGVERTINIKLLPLEKTSEILVMIDDVTGSEFMVDEAMHEEKISSFKTLIRGLVKNFSGILSELIDAINIMELTEKSGKHGDGTLRHNIRLVEQLTEKAYSTIQRLNEFSLDRTCRLHPVDLRELLVKLLERCNNIFDDDVELSVSLPESPIFISADKDLLELAIYKICENAAHATTVMRQPNEKWGGMIELGMDKIFTDRNYRQIHPLAVESSYWILSISDNGVGMDLPVLRKIFDPFFTTEKNAAGIGLSIAFEIIRSHRGFIETYSQKGQGSRFLIFLPDSI